MTSTTTAFLLLAASVAAADKPANHLASETSPYLLQHAHNPVDWYPWGDEAFAKAKKEGKLVFLSVGYSSCHWCHVMERESFENQEVADLLNSDFVSHQGGPRGAAGHRQHLHHRADRHAPAGRLADVAVPHRRRQADLRRRPTCRPTTRTADGDTIPGLKTLLKAVKKFRDEQAEGAAGTGRRRGRADDGTAGRRCRAAPAWSASTATSSAGPWTPSRTSSTAPTAASAVRPAGFRGTKFPMPPSLLLLQHEAARDQGRRTWMRWSQITLDHMARGGIYDHLGGGFHRYSTERTWTVPHFEKMLYDNAQLLEVYALAYQSTK